MGENEANGSNEASVPSNIEKKIIKQVEFYFGNVNLARDTFLQAAMKEDDGWVPLTTMVKFNRLAQLSDDHDVIAAALKKSTSGLMEVNEDGARIRRSADKPMPEITKDRVVDSRRRSVYANNFPLEATLDDLMEFFETYGEVEVVKMRKDADKKFKGSVFVTFVAQESVGKFLEEPRTYKVDENSTVDLITKLQEDYFKNKQEEKKKQGHVKKEERDAERKEKEGNYEKEQEERFLEGITRGSLLEVTGLKEDTTREDVKDVFSKHGTVAWQDFNKGETKAIIRFEEEGEAKKAWEAAVAEATDGKVTVKEAEVEGRLLEGDEETEHWREMRKQQREKRNQQKGGRGGGRGRGGSRGRGGRGRGGRGAKRYRGSRGDDGPPAKKEKSDD